MAKSKLFDLSKMNLKQLNSFYSQVENELMLRELNCEKMTIQQLELLDAQVNMELYRRRLCVVRKTLVNSKDMNMSAYAQERIQTLLTMAGNEIMGCKRYHILDISLTELEILLNIEE